MANGVTTLSIAGGPNYAWAGAVVGPDGKIVLGGVAYSGSGTNDMTIARYLP